MEKKLGEVTHFFAGPSAAVLRLSSDLKVGDEIHIVGFTTDLTEKVMSMQINHSDVSQAGPGDDVAILVKDRVREGDEVFLADKEAMAAAPLAAAPKAITPMAPALSPGVPSTPMVAPKPAAPKPAAKPAAKAPTKAKPKAKKAKKAAKPKGKKKPDKSKAKAKKAKPKAKAKSKAKAKPKKKSRR